MQVLKILSTIWKSGAEMSMLPSGEIEMKNHKVVPPEIMKAAEQVFPQIEEWFKSWANAKPIDITIQKILHQYCGWTKNESIINWLNNDVKSTELFHDWTVVLAKNGWMDIYEDYRQFENDESKKMAQEIYERAVAFAKKGA
ncbi:hypothetical protein [Rummeliibacillus stabekisii]|uniref:hypothetical protein n=1 Tax=Rummeliibacillus stabekisii TaxID=241244 RepID=UPI003712BEE4